LRYLVDSPLIELVVFSFLLEGDVGFESWGRL